MKLNLEKTFLAGVGLSLDTLRAEGAHIEPFLKSFESRGQGFPFLPKLRGPVLEVKKLAEQLKTEQLRGGFHDIVVLGIGGSALGVSSIRDALLGSYWNHYGKPRLFVLDNVDTLPELERCVDLDRSLFIVISKSGTTPETLAQFFYFREKVSKENFVFITDPHSGELHRIAEEYRIPCLEIPENVGGRFSVLSPVGLFPAELLGVDIETLLEGAEAMASAFRSLEWEQNLPFQFASVQYLLERNYAIPMTVLMPYSTRLYGLADWYRQLLAESIGKEGTGLTPIRALGVTDQHSQLQLYNAGPRDKWIVFIEVEREASPRIPSVDRLPLHYLSGHSFHELMNLGKKGTEQALQEYQKPTATLHIPEVNAYELGQLFMFFEASIAFLGEYYRINAFDQPGVELSKQVTKTLLSP